MPSPHHDMGSPSGLAAATATPTFNGGAITRWQAWHIRPGPQQQPIWVEVCQFQHITFWAVSTGNSPGGSASTDHDPVALLCDKRHNHRQYGQINTINALGQAAARTRPTLLVQLWRITIEALMDTRVSATVINEKTLVQVAKKDKVRLDIHGDKLGLTGATQHPLDIVGVFKI